MNGIILTQYDGKILGPIAWVLGIIMKGIFNVLDFIGIPNIGLSIILFTIVIYLLLMPLTIKQQKFSKLSAKMNPEIQAIQEKYKNRKDSDSQFAMQQETQAVYAKYGVSPTGSCVQLLIQMPILFALYRVINAIPAYVTKIGDTFRVLAAQIIEKGGVEWLRDSGSETISRVVMMYGKKLTDGTTPLEIENGVIDVLNRLSSSDMALVASKYDLTDLIYDGNLILSNETTRGLIDIYNNFLGLNMGETPNNMIRQAIEAGQWLIVIGAIAIPVLSAVTQWINVKLMPQQDNSNVSEKAAQMQRSMKTMNMVMPVMSAWFCFTLPAGMGLYWVAGSVVRSIQQVVINKHIDKMDFDEIIKKNSSKSAKKMEKLKKQQERMNEIAAMNTRNIQRKGNTSASSKMTEAEKEKAIKKASEYYDKGNAKPGSMMAKANMVKKYNEKNNKEN